MNNRNNPGDDKHVQTSSSNKTMRIEKLKQETEVGREGADRVLKPTGLDVNDLANQSSYRENEGEVIDRVAEATSNENRE